MSPLTSLFKSIFFIFSMCTGLFVFLWFMTLTPQTIFPGIINPNSGDPGRITAQKHFLVRDFAALTLLQNCKLSIVQRLVSNLAFS